MKTAANNHITVMLLSDEPEASVTKTKTETAQIIIIAMMFFTKRYDILPPPRALAAQGKSAPTEPYPGRSHRR